MMKMLTKDASERISAADCLKHDWFEEGLLPAGKKSSNETVVRIP